MEGLDVARCYRAHDRAGAMAALSKCIRQAVQLAILLTAVYLVLLDQVTVGIIFAASILASRALAPLDGLAGSWRQIVAAVTSLQQLDPLLQAGQRPDRAMTPARLTGALAVEALTLHSRDAEAGGAARRLLRARAWRGARRERPVGGGESRRSPRC